MHDDIRFAVYICSIHADGPGRRAVCKKNKEVELDEGGDIVSAIYDPNAECPDCEPIDLDKWKKGYARKPWWK